MLPVPDELLGNRLRAVISADGPGLTREECSTTAAGGCPAYMVPDVVEFCEALPRTSTGKVDRAGLAGHGTPDPGDADETGATSGGASQVEAVINDYISRELVQDPALLPLANDDVAARDGHP